MSPDRRPPGLEELVAVLPDIHASLEMEVVLRRVAGAARALWPACDTVSVLVGDAPRDGRSQECQREGIHSALAVPMLVDGRVEGVVSLFDRAPAAFDHRDEAAMRTLAEHAGAAVRNARLHAAARERSRAAERLAASRERVRLANEIHDTLSQVLFSIGLKLDWCLHQLAEPSAIRTRLEDIRRATGFTMAQVRTLIARLTPDSSREDTLGERIGVLIDQFRKVTGAAAEIVERGEVGRLDPRQQDLVYHTLQEVLARVVAAGPAARVVVSLEVGAAEAIVEVADDPSGFRLRAAFPLR